MDKMKLDQLFENVKNRVRYCESPVTNPHGGYSSMGAVEELERYVYKMLVQEVLPIATLPVVMEVECE